MAFNYLGEFLSLAAIHFLAVVAPGPDFAVTIRQSIRYGHQAGMATAIGIGAGISVHVIYTLLGMGALMHATPWLLLTAELVGASYLFYLGVAFIRQAGQQTQEPSPDTETGTKSFRESFMLGFLTNATNPKATLFFLAVFTTVVSASTPLRIQVLYGGWMCLVNASWFVLVSLIFANESMRQRFWRIGHWFERLMGLLLLGFSIRLYWVAFSEVMG
ncbi:MULTISPECIES: LysE family translocator [Pectobacterium]|uniref:LysE family translocator n=1 Tax=Pectobacterium punjabense TaxID=2108399 RepID=A0ABX6L339_9GAMM|nr:MULTISPECIES: LysE family transporter [Pectobacterium]GKW10406.1 lysine transporter LysE [Pectobacterium carotovorum subsp. carotovorum]MBN3137695.1 LysE family transporter [Pectobacterium punjabense]MBS4431743.1 LysE family transporter [Pectobacterium punjabense]MBT9184321.1 LysE family transporter [Pectobacterium punjabense]MCE5379921.1 LysE family transporter [Pectobacterium punjabense]